MVSADAEEFGASETCSNPTTSGGKQPSASRSCFLRRRAGEGGWSEPGALPQRKAAPGGRRLGGARRSPAHPAHEAGGSPRELVRVLPLPREGDPVVCRAREGPPPVHGRAGACRHGRG